MEVLQFVILIHSISFSRRENVLKPTANVSATSFHFFPAKLTPEAAIVIIMLRDVKLKLVLQAHIKFKSIPRVDENFFGC